jgi:hypothetical protein
MRMKEIFAIVGLTLIISLIVHEYQLAEYFKIHDVAHLREFSTLPPLKTESESNTVQSANNISDQQFHIAIGIFSAPRPSSTIDYVYLEAMSILDTIMIDQTMIKVDKLHIFDGVYNGTGKQVKYFKYSKNIVIHPMDNELYKVWAEPFPVHRKASLNYLLTLKYLLSTYPSADGYLILEDDVIFDPDTSLILWKILMEIRRNPEIRLFLVDGYTRGPSRSAEEELKFSDSPFDEFKGDARCCSQSFLLSPDVAKLSIPLIEMSLNGTVPYYPLDIFLTSSLLKIKDFHYYVPEKCWVQHIGYPILGLGDFHRGCSRMTFDN